MIERLRSEFLDSCSDKLDYIDDAINDFINATSNRSNTYLEVQREIHSIKGSAGTHGFNSISLIAHRLEDYTSSVRRLSNEEWLEVQKFIDAIRTIVESSEELDEEQLKNVLSNLPSCAQPTLENKDGKKATILLVMPRGFQRKLVGTELSASGFDISFVEGPIQSIELALSVKPDAILSSQELTDFSGLELATIFKSIHATSKIPFVILTTHEEDFISKSAIKDEVHVVHKDKDFIRELTKLLLSLNLFKHAN